MVASGILNFFGIYLHFKVVVFNVATIPVQTWHYPASTVKAELWLYLVGMVKLLVNTLMVSCSKKAQRLVRKAILSSWFKWFDHHYPPNWNLWVLSCSLQQMGHTTIVPMPTLITSSSVFLCVLQFIHSSISVYKIHSITMKLI